MILQHAHHTSQSQLWHVHEVHVHQSDLFMGILVVNSSPNTQGQKLDYSKIFKIQDR